MLNFKEGNKFEFSPEEEKNWPLYIKERFDLFNSVQSLNFEKIIEALEKNPKLISLDLLKLIVFAIKQSKNKPPLPTKLLNKFTVLLDNNNVLDISRFIEICKEIGKPAIGILKLIKNRYDTSGELLINLIKGFVDLGDEKTAWEIFEKIKTFKSKFLILEAAYKLAEINSEKVFEIVESFKNDNDPFVRIQIARCLVKIDKINEAINILEDLKNDDTLAVKLSVIEILYEICNKYPHLESANTLRTNLVEELKNSDDLWYSLQLANKLIEINSGEENLILEILYNAVNNSREMTKESSNWIYGQIIHIAEMIGTPAIEVFLSLKDSKSPEIRIEVARALIKMGEVGLKILEEMKNDPDDNVVKEVKAAIDRNKMLQKFQDNKERNRLIRSLILRQEPFFANPFIVSLEAEQENPLLKLRDIVFELKENYPELVGLSVLGSFSKGYWLPSMSDMDWGLIIDGQAFDYETFEKIRETFKSECENAGFKLCYDNSFDAANLSSQNIENLEIAFNGLFIGDRDKLKEVQKKIMEFVSSEQWDRIRFVYNVNQKDSGKMMERFNLSREEFDFIVTARKFLWGLPDYETAKRQFSLNLPQQDKPGE